MDFRYCLLWLIALLISKKILSCQYLALAKPHHLRQLCGILLLSQLLTACSSAPNTAPQKRPSVQIQPSSTHQNVYRSARLAAGLQSTYSVPTHIAKRLSPLIIQSADFHGISPYLLAAVIHQESSYQSNATSPAGAVGLTQVMPKYWKTQCPGNLYDDTLNIQCGTSILSTYNKSAGNWPKTLAYYNVGPKGYHSNVKMRSQGEKYARSVEQHHQNLIHSIQFQPISGQQAVGTERPQHLNELENPQ